jgi:hypothetical protein
MQKQQQHGHEQQSLLAGPSYEGVLWLLGKASYAFKLKLFNLKCYSNSNLITQFREIKIKSS